jgi:phytoene dehydrogenase-like protein
MTQRVVVVGGGIAGLSAALYLARAGRTVTIFERRRHLGGRAVTHLRQGFRFNIGAHVLNRRGGAMLVYRELGVPVRGGRLRMPKLALGEAGLQTFPGSAWSMVATPLLTTSEKTQLARIVLSLRRHGAQYEDGPVSAWLDENAQSEALRRVLRTWIGLATYSADETQSAARVLPQLAVYLRGQLVLDEGWQRLVDALHNQAVSAGVNFVTSSRIVRVVHDDAVRGLELGELEDVASSGTEAIALGGGVSFEPKGTVLPTDHVILAVDPITAIHLVADDLVTRGWRPLSAVNVASLDVALRSLPDERTAHVVCSDAPMFLAAHSEAAHLAPGGGALLHVMKLGPSSERELQTFADELQPGWRELVVHKRFLPSLVASNALVNASWKRPQVATGIRGLYLAGDWVGNEGLLSDAAALSARAAARAIIAGDASDR